MRIVIRSLSGESTEIDIEPTSSISELKHAIQAATKIPVAEQRLVFAGTQLEEAANEAWRKRRCGGALSTAMGVASIPDGAPLTLEHYAIQKGSVVNIVRRIATNAAPSDANASGPPATDAPVAAPAGASDPLQARDVTDAPVSQKVRDEPTPKTPVPVLEFLVPDPPRNAAAPAPDPFLGRGGGYGGSNVAQVDSELVKQLNALSDTALHQLIAPLLDQRPKLRATLLAPGSGMESCFASPAPPQRLAQNNAEDASRHPPRPPVDSAPAAASRADPSQHASPWGALAGAGSEPDRSQSQPYRTGDAVQVWSNSGQRWCDGEVLKVAKEASGKIPQGAVEVSFELGQKWIAPHDATRILKSRSQPAR